MSGPLRRVTRSVTKREVNRRERPVPKRRQHKRKNYFCDDEEFVYESSSNDETPSFLGSSEDLFSIGNEEPWVSRHDREDIRIHPELEDFVVPDEDSDEGESLYFRGLFNSLEMMNQAAHYLNSTDKITRGKLNTKKGVILPDPEKEKEVTKQEERHGKRCPVCLSRSSKTTIVDCGHSVLCVACAISLGSEENPTCPVCKKKMTHVIRSYF